MVYVGLVDHIVDRRNRQQQAREDQQRRLYEMASAHETGTNRGEIWWRMNSACTASVAASRRRSRATTASGNDHSVYQGKSQVLVTEIASSVQPEAATQS